MRLKDKVAIITGGSKGIGFATADAFLREGAKVILTASSQESADAAVEKLKEKYPDSIIAGISPESGKIELCAGGVYRSNLQIRMCGHPGKQCRTFREYPFTEYTEEDFDRVMDLNVKGVFNATRAASECMIARGNGVIFEHFLHGEHQRTGQRYCISHLEICGKRADSFAGKRAGRRHPGQRGGSRNHRDRYDEGGPKDVIEPLDRTGFSKKAGTARGYPNALYSWHPTKLLHYRRCNERRRYGAVLTGGAAWDFWIYEKTDINESLKQYESAQGSGAPGCAYAPGVCAGKRFPAAGIFPFRRLIRQRRYGRIKQLRCSYIA